MPLPCGSLPEIGATFETRSCESFLEQSLCVVDYATIEWHEVLFRRAFLQQSASARGIRSQEAGSESAERIHNLTKAAIKAAVASPDCKLQHLREDAEDETHMHDKKPLPLPGTSVCH